MLKSTTFVASHGGRAAGAVAVFHVQPDQLDSPRVVVNASNTSVWRWDSAPFGDTLAQEQPGGGSTPAFNYSLRFPGQQYDSESGLHYNYFRDYEPGVGRYVQSDPIGLAGGFNSFSYAKSSPLELLDPLGLAVTVTSTKTGQVIYHDPNYPHPCPTGTPSQKAKPEKLKC